jgi:hypothetical protein
MSSPSAQPHAYLGCQYPYQMDLLPFQRDLHTTAQVLVDQLLIGRLTEAVLVYVTGVPVGVTSVTRTRTHENLHPSETGVGVCTGTGAGTRRSVICCSLGTISCKKHILFQTELI